MALKTALLASVALALGTASASADSSKLGWYGSIEGGWSFVHGGETVYAIDRSAYPDLQERNVNLGDGVNGAIYLGYRLNNGWDFGLGVRGLVTLGNRDTTARTGPYVPPGPRPPLSVGGPVHDDADGYPNAYEYSHARADTDLTSIMLDFEAGYDAGIGGDFDLRVFGGLRAGFITTDTDVSFGYSMADLQSPALFQVNRSSQFVGAGPRLGVSGSYPLSDSFSLFGGLSGAVLLGQLSNDYKITGYGDRSTLSDSDFRAVYQLEGEIGVSYDLSDAGILGSLQLGYRGGQTWNAVNGQTPRNVVDPPLDGLRFGDAHDDLTTHGPFVRVVFKF